MLILDCTPDNNIATGLGHPEIATWVKWIPLFSWSHRQIRLNNKATDYIWGKIASNFVKFLSALTAIQHLLLTMATHSHVVK